MTNTRVIKSMKSWTAIVNASPELLNKYELDLKELKSIPLDDFKEVIALLKLGKIKHPFTLNLSGYDTGAPQSALTTPYFELVAGALTSGNCPMNFALNLCHSWLCRDTAQIQHLANALASGHCPKGFLLNLSRNYLHGHLFHFSKAWKHSPAQFKLSLENCNLNDDDIATLFETDFLQTQIKLLDLKHNQISDDGALVILASLKKYGAPCNFVLDLTGNKISASVLADINEELSKYQAKAICATLQQGMYSKDSPFYRLSQAETNHIYQFLFPLKNGVELKSFEKMLKSQMHKSKRLYGCIIS